MKRILYFAFLVLTGCQSVIPQADQRMILSDAGKIMAEDPLQALRLLNLVTDSVYQKEKERLLFQFYLNQREYYRAESLLGRISTGRESIFLVKIKTGDIPIDYAPNLRSKAILATQAKEWDLALRLFSLIDTADPIIRFYHLKTLLEIGDSTHALKLAETLDSLPGYLLSSYYQMMVELLIWSDQERAIAFVDSIRDRPLRYYYKYQIKHDKRYLWQILRNYPLSWAADFALQELKPRTKRELKIYGRALFKRGDYRRAISYLRRLDTEDALFLLGMCYLRLGKKDVAYGYLKESGLPEAYYEIGQSLPDSMAISYYEYIVKKNPKRSLLRKSLISQALALERMGRLNDAVEIELKFVQEFPGTNTGRRLLFRAAINLIRLGELNKADSLLALDSLPRFLYWRGWIRKELGASPDSFYRVLIDDYPFSYYTIYRLNQFLRLDTLNIKEWVISLADTDNPDTLRLLEVKKIYNLGLVNLADQIFYRFSSNDPVTIYHFTLLAKRLGFDWHAIRFARKLIRIGINNGKRSFPIELIRLAYPVHYLPSLIGEAPNLPLSLALIWQESNFNPAAVSPAGATGLLQIMPRTGRLIAQELEESDPDLFHPNLSIRYGLWYHKNLVSEFQSEILALIGYNAGPHRVRKWMKYYPVDNEEVFIELIPFLETRNYVKRILMIGEIYRRLLNLGDPSQS